jgi:hypothetical protein
VDVEMFLDDLWLGVKSLSNLEIAGSPRYSCRTSARIDNSGGRALNIEGPLTGYHL